MSVRYQKWYPVNIVAPDSRERLNLLKGLSNSRSRTLLLRSYKRNIIASIRKGDQLDFRKRYLEPEPLIILINKDFDLEPTIRLEIALLIERRAALACECAIIWPRAKMYKTIVLSHKPINTGELVITPIIITHA